MLDDIKCDHWEAEKKKPLRIATHKIHKIGTLALSLTYTRQPRTLTLTSTHTHTHTHTCTYTHTRTRIHHLHTCSCIGGIGTCLAGTVVAGTLKVDDSVSVKPMTLTKNQREETEIDKKHRVKSIERSVYLFVAKTC